MSIYRFWLLIITSLALAACRIEVTVPDGGSVVTESHTYLCGESAVCSIEVEDTGFVETFTAMPKDGFVFAGWRKQSLGLCGGSLEPCQLDASYAADSPALMALIESDQAVYLEPQFLPEDQIRRYQPGDVVRFEGRLAAGGSLFPASDEPVLARLEIAATTMQHGEFAVLEGRLALSDADGIPIDETSVRFWQDGFGGIYQLTDENGNVLLDTAANEEGIPFIPSPLEPFASVEMMYSAMWGGHTSTPLTEGSRSIHIPDAGEVAVPAGVFLASAVAVTDDYSYLVSFDDYKRGQTIKSERTLTLSMLKGIVRLEIDRRLYSENGGLLETLNLSLDAVGFSY